MIPLFLALLKTTPYEPATPPDAAPITVTRSYYSGGRIQIDIRVGDASAQTRIYVDGVIYETLEPGVTSYPSGAFSLGTISATHYKGGVETAHTYESGGEA